MGDMWLSCFMFMSCDFRLTNELRTSIQQQLDECDIDQLPAETAMVDSVIVSNLEHQLRNALRVGVILNLDSLPTHHVTRFLATWSL